MKTDESGDSTDIIETSKPEEVYASVVQIQKTIKDYLSQSKNSFKKGNYKWSKKCFF